ncbi:hypothetical protein GMD78_09945 [Ornithinibacillus sp. L9]|uniref:Uncharacterized protein n=1 Tax=Ornithinibacillus caprae TaxID=2678566 RepID=A0A6N8FGX9_9BACI|nr:hypothetical protein [Ornithinibacillus caprae]MUK88713.1 hypothetical protein [Ornithinibacillus caprae]
MVNDMKEAMRIASFELQASWAGFIYTIIFFAIYTLLIILLTETANNIGIYDLLFIVLFTFAPIWMKPKVLQDQVIRGDLWISPILHNQMQLPLPKEVIAKSRLIIYFVYSLPAQVLVLICMYLFSTELQNLLAPSNYIAFSITWLSFGIFFGSAIVTYDTGMYIVPNKKLAFILSGLLLVFIIFGIVIFPWIFSYGIVHFTAIAVQKWPIPIVIFSILIAYFGLHYWKYKMIKNMETIDYQ